MKNKPIRLFTLLLLTWFAPSLQAQQFIITGGNVTQNGGSLVVNDMDFVNNGDFFALDGKVSLEGSTTTTISGTSVPVFDTLAVAKTSGDVQLSQNVLVGSALQLQGGHLYLQNSDLQLLDPSTITGATASQHVKTTGSGTLIQPVADSDVLYPVGNSTYNPAILNNSGTADNFAVRVSDDVRTNGSSGSAITSYAVDRTWHTNEETASGSNLDITLLWDNAQELCLQSTDYVFGHYSGGWNNETFGPGGTTLGLNSLTLENTSLDGLFAIFGDRSGYVNPYVCEAEDLDIMAPISTQMDRHASATLQANNTLASSADVIYTAGNAIILKDGFTAEAGAYFHAFIFTCTFSNVQTLEGREEVEELPQPIRKENLQVELFPNPFRESTNVQFYLPEADEVQLIITDMSGKVIKTDHKLQVPAGWNTTTFEPGNLPSGMYILALQSNEQTVIKKMVVKRN